MRGLLILGAAVALAGCVSSDAVELTHTTRAPEDESATVVTGTVLNAELAAIPGALVQLDKEPPVTTDGAGKFRIPTTAGEHMVTVQAIGYVSMGRSVTVVEGSAVDVQFTLEALEIIVPYKTIEIFDGYDICSYATPTNVGTAPSPCPLGEPKNVIPFELKDSWRYFVVELAWETQNSFWVSINTPGEGCLNTAPCPGVEIGDSPVRIDGAPNSTSIAERWALDGKKMYPHGAQKLAISNLYAGEGRELLNDTLSSQCGTVYGAAGIAPRMGCPLGVGYSTGIRFQEYVTTFHWEAPAKPMEFSALPDG